MAYNRTVSEPAHEPKATTRRRQADRRDPRARSRRRLAWVVGLTGIFMVLEIVGGAISGSISLLTDGLHMVTHFAATGISLLALILAARPSAQETTFRYWRLEILAALFNGLALLPAVGWIGWEAYRRVREPAETQIGMMAGIGAAGFVANLACAWILHGASKSDLNVRGAFLHMLSDSISSIAVLLAAGLMVVTGNPVFDPIVAAVISVMVLVWSFKLILDSGHILLEAAPRGIKIGDVESAMRRVPGVRAVHDLHLWVITSRMYNLTAHVVLERNMSVAETAEIARRLDELLDCDFDVTHTTYQFEPPDEAR